MRLLQDVVTKFLDWKRGRSVDTTFAWGIDFLDNGIGRALPGSLIIVAGRPNSGKSFLGLYMMECAAVPSLYVSLEDPDLEVGRRVQGMSKEALKRIALATPKRRSNAIEAAIRAAYEDGHKPKLVVIDYLQLIKYAGDVVCFNEAGQIGNAIGDLKDLAKELGFVLVMLCQIRRPANGDEDREPTIFELRGSSDIENSAEVVLLIHDQETRIEVRVGKSKSTKRGAKQTFSRDAHTGFLFPVADDSEDLFEEAS